MKKLLTIGALCLAALGCEDERHERYSGKVTINGKKMYAEYIINDSECTAIIKKSSNANRNILITDGICDGSIEVVELRDNYDTKQKLYWRELEKSGQMSHYNNMLVSVRDQLSLPENRYSKEKLQEKLDKLFKEATKVKEGEKNE